MNFSHFKITFSFDKKSLAKINFRPFVAGMITVFIFKLIMIMGYTPNLFVSPIPNTLQIFDSVQPKLEQKLNDFKLSRSPEIVPAAYAAVDYDSALSYIVYDLKSGEVLMEKNSDEKLPIASITKVMTAVVALDLASPDEVYVVSHQASQEIPTKIGVVPGEHMSLEELLYASLLTSANDAAEVVREGIDQKYGQEVFIHAMNEKAKLLGMSNTHFTNPQGFDDTNNFSTASDLAILSHYALSNYPLIKTIVGQEYHFIKANSMHKQFDLYNWNGLIGIYSNAYGVKIGNTDDAGITAMVAASRDNNDIGVVLLGAPNVLSRDMWASQLLDAGFEKLAGLDPVKITEEQLRKKYATWKFWN